MPNKILEGFLDAVKAASLKKCRSPSRCFFPDMPPKKIFRHTSCPHFSITVYLAMHPQTRYA